jgi:hypothetical protein
MLILLTANPVGFCQRYLPFIIAYLCSSHVFASFENGFPPIPDSSDALRNFPSPLFCEGSKKTADRRIAA